MYNIEHFTHLEFLGCFHKVLSRFYIELLRLILIKDTLWKSCNLFLMYARRPLLGSM